MCGDRRVHGPPCYVVWHVRELEYYWRSCSVFPDAGWRSRSVASLYVLRPRGAASGILHLARSHRAPHRRRDNRYVASSAPAARACRRRGLVAAERNELRSMGASGSLGLCHLQSVDDVCHQPRPKRQSDSVPVTESSKIAEGILPSRLASQPAGEDEQNGNDRDHSESELRTTVAVLLLLHQLVLSFRGRHGRIARRSPLRVRQ